MHCLIVLAVALTVLAFPPPSWALLRVSTDFHVAITGSGSVSSKWRDCRGGCKHVDIDCRRTCVTDLWVNEQRTLVASPDRDSRFVRWEPGPCDDKNDGCSLTIGPPCGSRPTCSLTVGDVTRITAIFEKSPPPTTPSDSNPSTSTPQPSPPATRPPGSPPPGSRQLAPTPSDHRPLRGSQRRFIARVSRHVVIRGVRPRRVAVTVLVNARSSVRLVLQNARDRLVTSRTWEIDPGSRVLQLTVPKRARRGRYILRATVRDRHEHVERFERRIHLRR